MSIDYQDYRTCAIAISDRETEDSISKESIIGSMDGTSSTLVPMSFAVLAKLNQLWKGGSAIKYAFFGGTEKQQRKVIEGMAEWQKYANITFDKSPENNPVGADVRISFESKSGSWSFIGTDVKQIPSHRATLNLGWTRDQDETSDEERGTILHELGHTLGLLHEHQSPNRGKKITLDEDAVYAYYGKTQGWNRATIKSQVLDVYNKKDVSNYSEVDLKSIMMYFMPGNLNRQRLTIDPNSQLSDLDKAYMVINYPRPEPHPDEPDWTLEHAIKVAGIDEETAAAIRAAHETLNESNMRSNFIANMVAQRAPNPAWGLRDSPAQDKWCGTVARRQSAEEVPFEAQRGFIMDDHLWSPNSTIKYGFLQDASDATEYRKKRVRKALDDYEEHTSLKFELVELSNFNFEKVEDRNTCPVRICFGPAVEQKDGSICYGWSFTGTTTRTSIHDPVISPEYGGEKWTTVFLGPQPKDPKDDVNFGLADQTLYHELGHMLGLDHEHETPKSLAGDVSGGISGYLVSTLYDEKSVMLYRETAYDERSDRVTDFNSKPSRTDYCLLSLLYPDNGDAGGKFSAALEAFSFTNTESLLEYAAAALAPRADPKLLRALRLSIASDINGKARLAVPGPVIEQPAHGAQDPAGNAQGPTGGTQMPGFLLELIAALKQFFNPGENQVFTLQFPGRFLQQSEYAWDTSSAGIYGQFVKPIVVNEAEFRLVDQLYDVADLVGGPNGINLSIVYEQLLNNLFPRYVNNGLSKQQEQIRQWLLKDVPQTQWVKDIMSRQQKREKSHADAFAKSMGLFPYEVADMPEDASADGPSFDLLPGKMFDISSKGESDALNRIELSEILMSEYLYAKQDWELERDALINQASQADIGTPESKKALDALTRKLAHITATRQAQLASKYADAIVRGRSHNVRDYMGYLDIASPAEALQNAKDALRESAMSSLNGAMKVYPVQLTPIDWFEGLSTSFKLEDLTYDPESIRTHINAKSQQLDALRSQLVMLEMGASGDAEKYKKEVQEAQKVLDSAQSTLAQNYTNNVIEVAKTCLDEYGKVDMGLVSKKVKIGKAVLNNLPAQMETVRVAQDKLNSASRALSQVMAARALAEATDTRQQQQQLRLKIQSISGDINELQTRWQILTESTGGAKATKTDTSKDVLDAKQPVKLPEEISSGGSRWQTIRLTSSSETRQEVKKANTSANAEHWSLNLWLASGSGSSSAAHSKSAAASTASTSNVDLAFRATLVTVDRGGWFQPQFFKQSKAFYKVNEHISWVDGKNNVKGLMPGFPVGILIAKDIVIRVTHSTTAVADTKSFDEASSASSGGVLCFSYSRSDSSGSQETASNFQAYSNGFVVKIPGPQILGYMIQKTDEDHATLMPNTLPKEFFIADDEYNSSFQDDTKPANAPTSGAKPANDNKAPITAEKLREVVSKMFNERLEEVISQTTAAT